MPRPRKAVGHNWNPLFAAELRQAERAWRLGPDPVCARCGERLRAVLHRKGGEVLCYACIVEPDGTRRDVEIDHPLGRGFFRHHTAVVAANDNQAFNDPDDGPEARLRWALEPSEPVQRLLRRR